MRVPDKVLNAVVFLGFLENPTDPRTERFAGTGFLVGVNAKPDVTFLYLVTAKHVARGLERYDRPLARFNDLDGNGHIVYLAKSVNVEYDGRSTTIKSWHEHPDDPEADVAACIWIPPGNSRNSEAFSTAFAPIEMFLDKRRAKAFPIGIGDEVFVTGLFRFVYGLKSNSPIVRIGNIAMIPGEKVFSGATYKATNLEFGYMDAYLIEARSTGGLSGSPVFARGTVDLLGRKKDAVKASSAEYSLLGLIHGHWDVRSQDPQSSVPSIEQTGVNVGIAIVTPAVKIIETLNSPRLADERSNWLKSYKQNRKKRSS